MRRLSILGLVLAVTAAAPFASALDVPGLIATAPGPDAYPDADIVVLHHREIISMDTDQRVTRHVHSVRRLQTQWAMRNEADPRLAWDSSRQELTVLTARTYMVDGTALDTPENGFNEVTPDGLDRSPTFLEVRELVVTHIGTEPGCVVELEYEIRDLSPGPLPPAGRCWLGGEYPVLSAGCEVRGQELAVHAAVLPAGQTADQVSDLPAYLGIPRDQRANVVPHVDWGWAASADDPVVPAAQAVARATDAAAQPDTALDTWLAAQQEDPAVLVSVDLLDRIATLIHDETAAVHLPTGAWSRAPRAVADVHASAVGTDWERALVAMSLLRAAGLEPELGLFATGRGECVARPFTHLRVVTRIDDQNWWLAPDRGRAWSGGCDLPGAEGVFLANDGSLRRYTVRDEGLECENQVRIAWSEEDGWTATADLVISGLSGPTLDPRQVAEELAARLLVDGVLASHEVREVSTGRLALRLNATGERPDGEQPVWIPAWPDQAAASTLLAGLDLQRDTLVAPVRPARAVRLALSWALEVPPGWQVDAPLAGRQVLAAPGLDLEHQVAVATDRCRIDLTLAMDGAPINPTAWPEFRVAALAATRLMATPVALVPSP